MVTHHGNAIVDHVQTGSVTKKPWHHGPPLAGVGQTSKGLNRITIVGFENC